MANGLKNYKFFIVRTMVNRDDDELMDKEELGLADDADLEDEDSDDPSIDIDEDDDEIESMDDQDDL